MIKNNAILILKTFSDEEVRLFDDFLNSPFHNKNNKVIQLFSLLKKYHPVYDDERISKEILFKELFGDVKFRDFHIRNLFSDLNILAEKFLQYIHLSKDYTYEKLLMEELNNRDLHEILEKKVRMFEGNINRERLRDQSYYSNKVFIYEIQSS